MKLVLEYEGRQEPSLEQYDYNFYSEGGRELEPIQVVASGSRSINLPGEQFAVAEADSLRLIAFNRQGAVWKSGIGWNGPGSVIGHVTANEVAHQWEWRTERRDWIRAWERTFCTAHEQWHLMPDQTLCYRSQVAPAFLASVDIVTLALEVQMQGRHDWADVDEHADYIHVVQEVAHQLKAEYEKQFGPGEK